MSHQLSGKKWSFEIPPLDWKAPDADQNPDRDAIPVGADSSKESEASRSKT